MIKPSYDLAGKTDHEIILLVRDQILEPMKLRIRLYPSFVKQSHKCKNREELLVLVKKIILKAKELSQELDKPTLEKHTTQPFSKVEKFVSTKNTREREGIPITSTIISSKKVNPQKKSNDTSLSVWEKLQEYKANFSDPDSAVKLAYYVKHQEIIRKVIDPHRIFCVNRATKLAQEEGIRQSSSSVVSCLLERLHIDGYLKLESIPCGRRHLAQVYFTDKCTTEQYERYTTKLKKQEEQANRLTKNVNPQKKSNDEIVNKIIAHNEAVRKGTIEQRAEQEKEFIEYSKTRREQREQEELEKSKEERTNSRIEPKDPTKLEGEFKKMFDTTGEELKEIYKLDEKKVGHDDAWKKYQVKKKKSHSAILKQQQESYQQETTGGKLNDN